MPAADTTNREYLQEVSLQKSEALVGVYENTPGTQHEAIVISTLGLRVLRDDSWTYIRYDEIERADTEGIDTPQDKQMVDGLWVRLASGESVWLPVKGRQGKFRDAFTFLHFLRRVLEHIERQA